MKEYIVQAYAHETIDELDQMNAPELVRCKDCKYNSGNCHGLYAQFITCYKTGSPRTENWFCADGKRREKRE